MTPDEFQISVLFVSTNVQNKPVFYFPFTAQNNPIMSDVGCCDEVIVSLIGRNFIPLFSAFGVECYGARSAGREARVFNDTALSLLLSMELDELPTFSAIAGLRPLMQSDVPKFATLHYLMARLYDVVFVFDTLYSKAPLAAVFEWDKTRVIADPPPSPRPRRLPFLASLPVKQDDIKRRVAPRSLFGRAMADVVKEGAKK